MVSGASSFVDNPAHWRQRAKETRVMAAGVKDEIAKATMLRIAGV